jgi:hypothetical protein
MGVRSEPLNHAPTPAPHRGAAVLARRQPGTGAAAEAARAAPCAPLPARSGSSAARQPGPENTPT